MFGVALAALLVLILPGPTNALVAVRAARLGPRRAMTSVFLVLAAYATSVTVLVLFSVLVGDLGKDLGAWLKALIVAYLLYLAFRLWTSEAPALPTDADPLGPRAVLAVTLLNPKTLVLAWLIRRDTEWPAHLVPDAVGIVLAILIATTLWLSLGGFGALAFGARAGRYFSRAGAVVVLVAAGVLAFSK